MDILKKFEISYFPSGKEARELIVCFDNGSPYTFIKKSSAGKVGKLIELAESEVFVGLGDGTFQSSEIILLHVKLLEFWCRQLAYVVEDNVLERGYDILAGHDFMQLYGIKLLPHKGEIEIDEERLSLAQKVRLLPV
ncbi:MAG: hypothetical protein ONB05_02360 [candidate division KSB1 bacterium]|nr:hypothetical protein [candidate division KSB1 bacterium]